ncbi:MAG: hypothetical protein HYR94_07935 [Chloroflexi bacterium]|nr:hypothetical protein [Chloroflexota bacterium]
MNSPDTNLPASFKVFLFFIAAVFAGVAIILIISATSAATATGSAPAMAVALIDGPNTGVIASGEERWFRLSLNNPEQAADREQSLTLIFTPDNGQRREHINIQVFDESQLPFFYLGDTSRMANLGAGQIVSRDDNPVTGELFWTGWLSSQKEYYIQLANGSDSAIDYWLFTDNVTSYPLGQPVAPAAVSAAPVAPPVSSEAPPPATQAVVPVAPEIGADPGNPLPLSAQVTHNSLKPGATHWYSFTHNDPANPDHFQNLNFTLFFTPADNNRQQQINFRLFPVGAVEMWRRGETDQLVNFGAGMLVSRDGDAQTGERFWSGTVIRGDTYLLAIENAADVEIQYWLFDANVEHAELKP